MRFAFTRRSLFGLAFALAALPTLTVAPAQAEDVTVFAAASLKNALDDVAAAYKAETGKSVLISYAASNALAKQIEEAAPADIFFSADLAWMDYLDERNLIQKDTRQTLLGNEIVLVAPADSTATVTLGPGADLAALLGADGRLAMANVDSVPAGKYGKAALEKLGIWASVADRVVQADNVRAALAFVATGEAPLGIVYQTDANSEPKVKVVATFPADSHPPILYPVGDDGVVDQSRGEEPSSTSCAPTRPSPPTRSRASPSSRRQADVTFRARHCPMRDHVRRADTGGMGGDPSQPPRRDRRDDRQPALRHLHGVAPGAGPLSRPRAGRRHRPPAAGHAAGGDRLPAAPRLRTPRPDRPVPREHLRHRARLQLDRRGARRRDHGLPAPGPRHPPVDRGDRPRPRIRPPRRSAPTGSSSFCRSRCR